MYFPMSFPRSEYTQQSAIAQYDNFFFSGNLRALRSVGLTFEPVSTVHLKQDEEFYTVSLDQGSKYDMTPEARELFNKFVEQVAKDFNNKSFEERQEYA